jgi:hypothetical protein
MIWTYEQKSSLHLIIVSCDSKKYLIKVLENQDIAVRRF